MYGNHVVPSNELSRTVKLLIDKCDKCHIIEGNLVVLCGWHENSHAVSKAMRPLRPRDDQ